MRFGFDIDDTLINLREHAFHIYNRKLNKTVGLDVFHQIQRVEIHEAFDMSDEQGNEMWNSSLDEIYYTACPPFPGAVETLQALEKKGHEIYYITARPKEHGERSKDWLKQQGFPVHDDRFFYGMQDEEKIHIIQDLQLDYYVDDKPAVLNTLFESTTKLYVKDQAYNRQMEGIPRIIEWTDFIHKL
ncbi:5' nucleotidase, NT5C type [Oceanobacillus saliphilus]|uniref:5' nucleotidase, NT5C type n=1 Tax=Oceanobacillus saliphilus TaxID=2925834 RepID=UPI00201DFCCF|nr:HAD family acid phosphatase [Oceanobacillus saliphilus]